jgi:hypothetical protein
MERMANYDLISEKLHLIILYGYEGLINGESDSTVQYSKVQYGTVQYSIACTVLNGLAEYQLHQCPVRLAHYCRTN